MEKSEREEKASRERQTEGVEAGACRQAAIAT